MADILIRGMEMPKDGRITIQIGADGAVYFVEECIILAEKYEKSSHAMPLPKGHGKLGDFDALLSMLDILKDKGYYGPVWDQMRDIVKNMVIIVPAEGDNENGN